MPKPEEDQPLVRLARDEFTEKRRELDRNPEAVQTQRRIDVDDAYGNVVTWVLDVYRKEGQVTVLVQRGAPDGYMRFVIPPQVSAAIGSAHSSLISKHRRKTARRIVNDKRARGEQVGNPAALVAARAKKRRKQTS